MQLPVAKIFPIMIRDFGGMKMHNFNAQKLFTIVISAKILLTGYRESYLRNLESPKTFKNSISKITKF
jgi:hypothetical protein